MIRAVIALFAVVYLIARAACRLLGLSAPDTVAVAFCGSKKSLAAGLPMAHVMFGASPALSLIITPLMLYHFLQLVMVGIIASRSASRANAEALMEAEEAEPSLLAEDDALPLPEPVRTRV